ncbi:unnamed protein product [Symbiodinium necroappetens]|uniref:Uncharacterized protein n=1 Tax=Symbiodinium necroappetens TaxID=1628268 RepID=A0A812IYK7_9DINO|nr:unnamed protein product [Symbiodinium necroappetens]
MYASLHYVLQNVTAKTTGEERFSVLKVPPQGPIDYLYIDPVGVVQIDNVKKTTEHTSEILINPDIKLLAEFITKLQKAMTDTNRNVNANEVTINGGNVSACDTGIKNEIFIALPISSAAHFQHIAVLAARGSTGGIDQPLLEHPMFFVADLHSVYPPRHEPHRRDRVQQLVDVCGIQHQPILVLRVHTCSHEQQPHVRQQATLSEHHEQVGGIGGFLAVSREMQVLWSKPYLSRLWCIFELAAYRTANPEGKITIAPLYVEQIVAVILICAYGMAATFVTARVLIQERFRVVVYGVAALPALVVVHMLRKVFQDRQQLVSDLHSFDLDAVRCQNDFDREFIHTAILKWYGSKDSFREFVQGPLREELVGKGSRIHLSGPYLALLVLVAMTPGLEFTLAIYGANAPLRSILANVVAGVLGFSVLWTIFSARVLLYFCDIAAKPIFSKQFDWLQSTLVFAIFGPIWSSGAAVATMSQLQGHRVVEGTVEGRNQSPKTCFEHLHLQKYWQRQAEESNRSTRTKRTKRMEDEMKCRRNRKRTRISWRRKAKKPISLKKKRPQGGCNEQWMFSGSMVGAT